MRSATPPSWPVSIPNPLPAPQVQPFPTVFNASLAISASTAWVLRALGGHVTAALGGH